MGLSWAFLRAFGFLFSGFWRFPGFSLELPQDAESAPVVVEGAVGQVRMIFPVGDDLSFAEVGEGPGAARGGVLCKGEHPETLLPAIVFSAATGISLGESGDFQDEGVAHERPPI